MNMLQKRIYVSAKSITQYAKSIEFPVPTSSGELIAPATMPIIFWSEFDIPWLPMNEPLIHGSQQFSYEAPITAGMTLDCELSLQKVEKKAGRHGNLTLYTHRLVCTSRNKLIVTAETVLISVGDGI